jgi:hypothetical protein
MYLKQREEREREREREIELYLKETRETKIYFNK